MTPVAIPEGFVRPYCITPSTVGGSEIAPDAGRELVVPRADLFKVFDEMLNRAERDVVRPYLQMKKEDRQHLPQIFNKNAEKFAPFRAIYALAFVHSFGVFKFKAHCANSAAAIRFGFPKYAKKWGLEEDRMHNVLARFLSSTLQLVQVEDGYLDVRNLEWMLPVYPLVQRLDFGLTAMGLAFERDVPADEVILKNTFHYTESAIRELEKKVNSVTSGLIVSLAEPQDAEIALSSQMDLIEPQMDREIADHLVKMGTQGLLPSTSDDAEDEAALGYKFPN